MGTAQIKWMRGLKVFAEVLVLGSQLLETAREQTEKKGMAAARSADDFRKDASSGAEKLGEVADEQLPAKTSMRTSAIQFFVGVGVGIGAAILFTPLSGKEMREKFLTKTTHPVSKEPGSPSN